jgi:5-methylcytosine-specific restriction protein A
MNSELSATERRMLDLLIRHLPRVRPGYAPSYLGYKDVHEALGLEMHGSTYGISLQVQGLESLARHLRQIGAPALTGIVIDKTAGWPSHGYFNVHQRPADDFQFWIDESDAAKRFDWTGLLTYRSNPQAKENPPSNESLTSTDPGAGKTKYVNETATSTAVIENTLSFTKFLASLGCRLRIGWYWSAAAEDRSRVIFTVWADQIVDGRFTFLPQEDVYWKRSPGAHELRKHFPLAQMAGTEVYGVICKAVDEAATIRKRAYFNEHELVQLHIEERDGAWVGLIGDIVDVEQLHMGRLVVSYGDAYDDLDAPSGNKLPERRDTAGGSRILRDGMIRRYVLQHAAGSCELCGVQGFVMDGGGSYLECHHIFGLAAGGPDTVENVIALCANHHRQAHFGANRVALNTQMLLRVAERNQRVRRPLTNA